jgi:iron uptake system component EfeO
VAAGVLVAIFALAGAACGDDDGADVRSIGEDGSGSGSASGSGSGSGSGISASDIDAEVDNPLILDAVDEYRAYVTGQIDQMVVVTRQFNDAVRAGDVEGAKALYAPSRTPWERIEPIAGLIEDIDTAVDARVDDFASVDDPTWKGWHKLEYLLWETGDVSQAGPIADQLDADLAQLQTSFPNVELPPAALAVGASELIQEVSEGKITGEEDRYSHTDLWDFQANVEGSEVLIDLLRPALEDADPELLADIDHGFEELQAELATYRTPDGGFVPYTDLTQDQIDELIALLAPLSEDMALVAGVLELE